MALASLCLPLLFGVAAMLAACAPLTVATIPLGSAASLPTSQLARLTSDLEHPVLLKGFDGTLLPSRAPSALLNWSYLLSAGDHELWVVGAPAAVPLLPQRLRCYSFRASFVSGYVYTLSEDIDAKLVVLRREDLQAPVATSATVDNPLVIERSCKW
jgi:hypothetical protein